MRLNHNRSEFSIFAVDLVSAATIVLVSVMALVTPLSSRTMAQTSEGDAAILTIGSKAPDLDIETWFSDREGEFEHTTAFDPGKVYLIDFWSTWSPVSHPWMVKYAALQDHYVDDGLQIIRITDEDEDSVTDFLELAVAGNEETIYAEWALGYCVATDPDRSVHQDYIVAARQTNFPVVVIVGRTGLVEWIGAPSKMQKPLREILADKWDREAFGAKLSAEQMLNKMAAEVRELLQQGATEEALKLIEKMMAAAPDSEMRTEMARARLEILLQIDGPGIAEAFKEVSEGYQDSSYQLNKMAWGIVTRQTAGKEIPPDLLQLAVDAAKRGVELARNEGSDVHLGAVLDTQAHLVFLQGDLDQALEIQTEAIQFNGQPEIQKYLDTLHKEAAKRQKTQPPTDEQSGDSTDDITDDASSDASDDQSKETDNRETESKDAPVDETGIGS